VNFPEENRAVDPAPDALFTSSLRRIEQFIPALAVVVSVALGFKAGWPVALGFLVGSTVAYVNFHWLKSTVVALADAVAGIGAHASKPSVVLRFLTRFVLIALAAYVIFVSYPVAFRGFLGGLFTPVLAILAEATYLVYAAVRRGF
jgi:hypothetical protein